MYIYYCRHLPTMSGYTTIRVIPETHLEVLKIQGQVQQTADRKVTQDEVIAEAVKCYVRKLKRNAKKSD
jgi:hypothetical protein